MAMVALASLRVLHPIDGDSSSAIAGNSAAAGLNTSSSTTFCIDLLFPVFLFSCSCLFLVLVLCSFCSFLFFVLVLVLVLFLLFLFPLPLLLLLNNDLLFSVVGGRLPMSLRLAGLLCALPLIFCLILATCSVRQRTVT